MLLNINNSGLNSKCLTSHPDTCVPSLLHTDVMVLNQLWFRMYREKAILLRIIHAFKYDLKMAYISGDEFFDQENKQTTQKSLRIISILILSVFSFYSLSKHLCVSKPGYMSTLMM